LPPYNLLYKATCAYAQEIPIGGRSISRQQGKKD
jgi:hypothetical protein